METHNPATGELVDTYEEDSPSEVDAALDRGSDPYVVLVLYVLAAIGLASFDAVGIPGV